MKKILAIVFLIVAGLGGNIYGDEGWGPSVYRAPIVNQPAPAVQMVPYYYVVPVPVAVVVPLVPQYVPVTSYQNVLVERRYCCFFKRTEMVTVPQTVYVPIKY